MGTAGYGWSTPVRKFIKWTELKVENFNSLTLKINSSKHAYLEYPWFALASWPCSKNIKERYFLLLSWIPPSPSTHIISIFLLTTYFQFSQNFQNAIYFISQQLFSCFSQKQQAWRYQEATYRFCRRTAYQWSRLQVWHGLFWSLSRYATHVRSNVCVMFFTSRILNLHSPVMSLNFFLTIISMILYLYLFDRPKSFCVL